MAEYAHIIYMLPGFVVGLTVHEFSHALAADRLGDSTARTLGRLTLNPIAHLDVIGSIMLVVAGFGWAKPVPVDLNSLSYPRRDMALIASAGPISNIIIAMFCGQIFRLAGMSDSDGVSGFVLYAIWINVVLAIFNLIPVPPLDGSRILAGIIPENLNTSYRKVEKFGPFMLLGLVLLASATGVPILSRIINPIVTPIVRTIVGGTV